MDDDPELEIISSDTGGGLRIWDHNLKVCKEYKGNTNIKILGVEKVHKNSFPFIFTWYSYKNLRIFDNQLRTIFNYRFPKEFLGPNPIVPVSDGKSTSYVLTTDRTYLISPKPGISFKDYLPLLRSHFSFYLLGIFVFNGFLYVGWRQRNKIRDRYLEIMGKGTKNKPQWTVTAQEALHKMKSPITAILWETEKIDNLLEKKRPSKTFWSKLREINTDILADVNELKLMNHFLMKYLQVQTLHLREIDIKDIITCLTDKYQSSFSNKLTFSCKFSSPLPSLLADEEQLKEVFSNIIDNAIDAMANGGTISISAAYYKILPDNKMKNIICIEIEDNGCGIPKDKLDTIFEPYYTTKKEGTGIGLAIARRIVESHDGWIKVESREKIGTKFALYFPVKKLTH
jgi:anti-sigma regulatory factor (Ser/Thr protein kinase)